MKFFIGDKEEQLTKRLQGGDNTALKDFYSLYGGYLTGVCSRYISDDEDVKDVFQDALINIFSHIKDFKYRGAGSLQAWSTRITVNQSLNFLRGKNKLETTALVRDVADETEGMDPETEDISPEVLHRLVRELPTGYRTIFNLYVFENKSHKEIAEILGIKIDSSCSQFSRAKNLLAKMITDYRKNKNNPR